MNKIILFGIFSLWASSTCLAQTNQTESLTISTYYPSPYGVYRYLKLEPTNVVPSGTALGPGVIYYLNNTTANSILYYNKSEEWFDLAGGGGGGGGGGGNDPYWNKTSSDDIYNNNTGFVGIGNTAADFPLVVSMSNNDASNATVASFVRRVSGRDQYLNFNLYPPNLWAPYLNSTSVIFVPKDPVGNLEAATLAQSSHIRFNVGGFWDEESEVMRLVNSNPPDPRVGIGTNNPLATLHVENNNELTSPLMIRGMINTQVGLRKSAIFSVAPWRDRVYLTFGMYAKDGYWWNDPYTRFNGSTNYEGSKLYIRPIKPELATSPPDSKRGVWWNTYDSGNLGGGGRIDTWKTQVRLWDHQGIWLAGIACPSSRELKENFVAINPDDVLRKLDQLEVSRWKYRTDDKSITHIGPIAEDFNRLFKTGSQEDQLHLTDSIGVSLAGVKALVAKSNRQEQRLEELGQEIEDLKAQLSKRRAKR